MAAVEVLISTPAVRECLKDPSRIRDLRRHMADGRKQLGTQTFEQHVDDLVAAGTITADTGRVALSLGAAAGAGSSGKGGARLAASA